MYKEMEQVGQTDSMIDLKKQQQEYEERFKPAGMFANIWVEMLRWATAGKLTQEDMKILENAEQAIVAKINERKVTNEKPITVVEAIL